MESPPPAVFHDKAKRTQQGDLLPLRIPLCVHSDTFQVPIHCTDTELGGLAGVCCALGDVWMKWIHWFSAKYTWDIHDQYAKCLRKILCNRSMHIGTHNNNIFSEQRSHRPQPFMYEGKWKGLLHLLHNYAFSFSLLTHYKFSKLYFIFCT